MANATACYIRSSSLIEVFARVCASTFLTMTAQASECEPSAAGRMPGTTTEPAGTRPKVTSPRLAIVDPRARADEDAHREHRAALDDDALDDLGARADEAVVLDDRRARLQRLQHAADADAAREMHVAADLRAGADGRPGVDHRALADVGADVDERRHQHDVAADVRARAHDGARHDARAVGAEARGVVVRVA